MGGEGPVLARLADVEHRLDRLQRAMRAHLARWAAENDEELDLDEDRPVTKEQAIRNAATVIYRLRDEPIPADPVAALFAELGITTEEQR